MSDSESSINSGDSGKSVTVKESIDHIYKLLEFLTSKLDEKDIASTAEIKILFSRVEMFHTDLGSRSTTRTDNWQVPTIWGSLASLGEALDNIGVNIRPPEAPLIL